MKTQPSDISKVELCFNHSFHDDDAKMIMITLYCLLASTLLVATILACLSTRIEADCCRG